MMNRSTVIAAAIAAALTAASARDVHAAGPCVTFYDASVSVPSGWAAAYDLFHVQHTPLATVDCTLATVPLSVGLPNDSTVYVYGQAYVFASDGSSWSPVTLSAAQPSVGGWLVTPATAPLNLSSGQLSGGWNYIAFVTARWNGSKWLIGCADTVCATPAWSLQAIGRDTVLKVTLTPVAPSIVDTTALGATVGTIACSWSDASPCTATFSLTDTSGIYDIDGSNLIVKLTGPGVGAVGSSNTVTIHATQ